jgi:hypothetical protein
LVSVGGELRQTLKLRGATLASPICGSPPNEAARCFGVIEGEREIAAARH